MKSKNASDLLPKRSLKVHAKLNENSCEIKWQYIFIPRHDLMNISVGYFRFKSFSDELLRSPPATGNCANPDKDETDEESKGRLYYFFYITPSAYEFGKAPSIDIVDGWFFFRFSFEIDMFYLLLFFNVYVYIFHIEIKKSVGYTFL